MEDLIDHNRSNPNMRYSLLYRVHIQSCIPVRLEDNFLQGHYFFHLLQSTLLFPGCPPRQPVGAALPARGQRRCARVVAACFSTATGRPRPRSGRPRASSRRPMTRWLSARRCRATSATSSTRSGGQTLSLTPTR